MKIFKLLLLILITFTFGWLLYKYSTPYFNKQPEVKNYIHNSRVYKAVYLYKEKDQEVGFKRNVEQLPMVFMWRKPIQICFNMHEVNHDLYIYFFDKNKVNIGVNKMKANSDQIYCPPKKILYAVESIEEL
ncbi:DUF192 domain-containing protein [Acinetobacter baumannii]|nr:DUF192 domain-containing protein [Acinetobacter baumannii]